jgi:hypothetical protein
MREGFKKEKPEKYRERGSTAPRKGPSCQEVRPHLEEE